MKTTMAWTKPAYDEQEMEKILLRPYNYVREIRVYDFVATKFGECLNYWLRIPREKLDKIKEISNKINHSIAMKDDLEDDVLFRRKRPVTHDVFGRALTNNASWHAQYLAFEEILQLGHPKAAETYCKCFLAFLRGCGTSILWRDTQCHVTQEEYYQMMINQTGGVVAVVQKLMELFSNSDVDCDYFVKVFSLYYQLRDEYVNLKKPEAVEEGERIPELKGIHKVSFCEDFSEGKLSLPLLLSLNSQNRDIILGILKMRTRDVQTKEYLLSLLEEAGGIQRTRELLQRLEADIFAEIKRLGGNPMMEDLIRDLQTWDERI